MKIIDAIKIEGRPFEIPDCSRSDLPQFFKEMGFKVGVEIGVRAGDFSEELCKAGLKLYAVDPWMVDPDYVEPDTQKQMNEAEKTTRERLAKYDCTIIKKNLYGGS